MRRLQDKIKTMQEEKAGTAFGDFACDFLAFCAGSRPKLENRFQTDNRSWREESWFFEVV